MNICHAISCLNTKDTKVTKVQCAAQCVDFFSTIIHDHLKQRISIITQPTLVYFVPFVFKKL